MVSESRARIDPVLARELLEENQAEWIASHGVLPGVASESSETVTWVQSSERGYPNQVCRAFLDPEPARTLPSILDQFRCSLGAVSWRIGPLATPVDQGQFLRDVGFRRVRTAEGMVRSARAPLEQPRAELEFLARPVDDYFDEHEHPLLGRISTPLRRRGLRVLQGLASRERDRYVPWVAVRSGVPVGYVTAFFGARSAGIYDLAVLPSARHQGIGTALSARVVELALERGFEWVVLHATSQARSLYARLGFEPHGSFACWNWGERARHKYFAKGSESPI